ncbi:MULTISPECIES: hypothetical protein [Gluconobacter]|uniref:hypothetical protein n=1 Tax=Gluconobacter TaxID=441 RepID=UPI002010F247|nr:MULTISPECIES: hypothetical protein [Gluconobacter]MCP1250090.1 hypothetical protein [Gluconobacter oxydans]
MMGDILDYDKLCRITQATERMAKAAGQSVPLAAYNQVVDLHNDLVQRYDALAEKYRVANHDLDVMEKNRNEWQTWGRETRDLWRGRAEKAEARVVALEAELKAKGNRS